MELYTINIHFPPIYKMLGNESLVLSNTDYYESPQDAIEKAKQIANAFVTPKPDYWYLENQDGHKIWTDNKEETKRAIHYNILADKPIIELIEN